jgi:hypothetical protein
MSWLYRTCWNNLATSLIISTRLFQTCWQLVTSSAKKTCWRLVDKRHIFQACPVWIYTLRVTSHKHLIHLSTLHQHSKYLVIRCEIFACVQYTRENLASCNKSGNIYMVKYSSCLGDIPAPVSIQETCQGELLGCILLTVTKPRLFADDTNLTATGDSIPHLETAVNSDWKTLENG